MTSPPAAVPLSLQYLVEILRLTRFALRVLRMRVSAMMHCHPTTRRTSASTMSSSFHFASSCTLPTKHGAFPTIGDATPPFLILPHPPSLHHHRRGV